MLQVLLKQGQIAVLRQGRHCLVGLACTRRVKHKKRGRADKQHVELRLPSKYTGNIIWLAEIKSADCERLGKRNTSGRLLPPRAWRNVRTGRKWLVPVCMDHSVPVVKRRLQRCPRANFRPSAPPFPFPTFSLSCCHSSPHLRQERRLLPLLQDEGGGLAWG